MARPTLPKTLGFEDELRLPYHDGDQLWIGTDYFVWADDDAGFTILKVGHGTLCTGANILEVIALLHAEGLTMSSP